MSKLVEFRELERQLSEQLALLQTLRADQGLEQEIEFEKQLRSLLAEYDKALPDVIALLDPNATRRTTAAKPKASRKPRVVKVYLNPHNGQTVRTKGGNNKLLKLWKTEHGAEAVDSWVTHTRSEQG